VEVVAVPTHYEGKDGSLVFIRDITERKNAQARVEHLNQVLRSIRSVNQLISREKSEDLLVREVADLLVQQRSYESVLIMIKNGSDGIFNYTMAGQKSAFEPLLPFLNENRIPPCFEPICENNEPLKDKSSTLQDPGVMAACLLPEDAMSASLVHSGKLFGYILAVNRQGKPTDPEEELFLEIADDLAYGLNGLEAQQAREVAERARDHAQRQLLRSQKMESVGRLAGGVAHDFNNLLMGIMNYVELCREGVERDHPITEWLNEITVRQLLAFARRQTIAPVAMDLNEAIEGMLKMLRRLIGEDIQLLWEPQEDLWRVKMDPAQVDQILVNLCMNARDAIQYDGKILVETQNVVIDPEFYQPEAEFTPGNYVALAVSDDGTGMDTGTLENIFEPFFSTKGMGAGTGLGLATVYGIVKQNRGFVKVYSELGKGSTFRVFLPKCEAEPSVPTVEQVGDALSGGTETILLVEDEKSIRITTELFLKGLGYQVIGAHLPSEALRLAREHEGMIDLLITDIVMPEMSGRDLAEELARIHPDMKCLFMSGYTAKVIAHHGTLAKDIHFLAKPFSRKELTHEIRRLLDPCVDSGAVS
jgi:signal transduction histidine kinase